MEFQNNDKAERQALREQIHRYKQLFRVGQTITSEMDLKTLFDVIIAQTDEIIETERSTLFLYDERNNELWSLSATGLDINEIRIPPDQGVAGWVFQNRTSLIINDAYTDFRFNPAVDKKSGFLTRNIICIPLINLKGNTIGVLQALNKRSGDFSDDDLTMISSISHYITIALENAKLFEELKALDKAKERIVNHLSHELKTPLTVISGVLERISQKLDETAFTGLQKTLERGRRNVARLLSLQDKIDDILNQRATEEEHRIYDIVESAASIVEELKDSEPLRRDVLELVAHRLESLFRVEDICIKKIRTAELLQIICDEAEISMGKRSIEIFRNVDPSLIVTSDRNILKKVFEGILKNAIENTPDGGRIEICCVRRRHNVCVSFKDYGVGITPGNQELIFGGFFHTQDTHLYSTKSPYHFNAGGAGSDLLRIKIFSERFGFSVDFDSTRCRYIPTDTENCPGKISACSHITKPSECFDSGGSTFTIVFPDSV